MSSGRFATAAGDEVEVEKKLKRAGSEEHVPVFDLEEDSSDTFRVPVCDENGKIRKVSYEQMLKTKNSEWFGGDEHVSFKPDFQHPDYNSNVNFIYCNIPGYDLKTEFPANLKQIPQPWRQGEDEDSQAEHKRRRAFMKEFLGNYFRVGFGGFVRLIMMLIGVTIAMPALERYFLEECAKFGEEPVLEKFRRAVFWMLKADKVLTTPIYHLSGHVESATFSQEQCAAIVSWVLISKVNDRHNCISILTGNEPIHVEKLRFLFNYFEVAAHNPPGGAVSFRRVRNTTPESNETDRFNVKFWNYDLRIEETALCTQVDFANRNVGGGVLRSGSVQEEIRFLMCPEMIVAMLITGPMDDDEAMSIVGAQAYSSYSGYGHATKWQPLNRQNSRQNDPSFRDHYGRLRVETIAIDALNYKTSSRLVSLSNQLVPKNLEREFTKACVGFSSQGKHFPSPIVSGWWGCGIFQGHKPLKVLIQACAAARAGRELWICKFGDDDTAEKTIRMLERFKEFNLSPDDVMTALYGLDGPTKEASTTSFVFDALNEFISCELKKE